MTDRQTDEQMDRTDPLSRSRCRGLINTYFNMLNLILQLKYLQSNTRWHSVRIARWQCLFPGLCVMCVWLLSNAHVYVYINPLMGTGNYCAASNNMKLVHWPLMGGLLHLVQREGDWAGPQPVQAPPRCTKCNSPPINGQCTNHFTAVLVRCSAVLMCPLRGLTVD